MKPTAKEWIIGTDNNTQEEKTTTFIAFEMNQYIQRTNWKGEELSLSKFKSIIRSTEFIERQIAMKKASIERHDMKWKSIFSRLN